jgi:hypothetical protein
VREYGFTRWQSVGDIVEVEGSGYVISHELCSFVFWQLDRAESARLFLSSTEVPEYCKSVRTFEARLTETSGDEDQSCQSCTESHPSGIVGSYRSSIPGYLRVMETLATIAIESNGGITKHIIDEVVHSRFGELASFSTDARETSWTFDFLVEELVDVCG